jgi:energy-coupling factor transporter ATP-binding protein EcfA2
MATTLRDSDTPDAQPEPGLLDSEAGVSIELIPIDGLQEILSWSAKVPAWQQDALRRLCSGPDLDEDDEGELLAILKGEKLTDPISAEHIAQQTSRARTIKLKAIRDVQHVNALASGQQLSFGETGMTIVYGDNGSGKSGYVRILKAACRARLERGFEILPNIYDAAKGVTPSAELRYLDGPTHRSAPWRKGEASTAILSAISVFDAAAGSVHVAGPNEIAYTPFPLLVLARLARIADNLRVKLNTEVRQLTEQLPPTVTKHQCSSGTAAGKLLQGLSSTTMPAEVEALCTLTNVEKAELAGLRKDLADDPATIAKRSTTLAQRLEALAKLFRAIAQAMDDAALLRIVGLKREIALLNAAAEAEAKRRFAGDPLPVGNPEWHVLWTAAKEYAEFHAHPGDAFPQTSGGNVCVLCQRPHDEESADRLERFRAFVADELGKRLDAARAALSAAVAFDGIDYLRPVRIREVRDFLAQIGEAVLADAISAFLIRAAWRMRWLHRADGTSDPQHAPELASSPDALIALTIDALNGKARALQGAATSPERKALQARHDELSDRDWLSVVKDDVLKAISLKARTAALETLLPQTARAKITIQSTTLAKLLVTDRLRDRFVKEVAELGISRLRVELRQEKSEAGQPKFKVSFVAKPSESVGAVLSEGELRCLAIAAFLAELETAEGTSGIVLDDPICSLDHAHRERVAERLASEATHRQVIIFTHDVPFLSQLQQACRAAKAPLLMRLVSRGGAGPGFCHDDAPPTHRPIRDAIAAVARDIENKRRIYDTGDPDWVNCVTSFGGILRKLWERAVEDVLSPVFTRWTPKIDTSGFSQLTVLTLEDHKVMREGFGLCSIWEHYQPAAANTPQASADDIAAEATKLAAWIDDIKARQKAADKALRERA